MEVNYKQKYYELLGKHRVLQSELKFLRQEADLRESTLAQHLQFLILDSKSKKEQLESAESRHRLGLEQERKRAEEEFKATHEAIVQIYKHEQERLQQLVSALTEKLAAQTKTHEKVVSEYRSRLSQIYVESFDKNSHAKSYNEGTQPQKEAEV